jgi:hypothetical protein
MRKLGAGIVLLCVFLVSIGVRQFGINNVVDNTNHPDIFMLETLKIWGQRGLADCHFSPIQTFGHPGDKGIAYYKRLESKQGDNYFVSFPPFSFLLAYGLLKLAHLIPGKLAIQVLNLALHLVSAFFIYMIVFEASSKNAELKHRCLAGLHIPSMVAYGIYLFTPVLMYVHVAVFCPEIVGLAFWVIALYFTMNWFNSASDRKNAKALLLGSIVFLMIYTEWIGLFYVGVLLFILLKSRKEESRKHLFLIRTLICSTVLSLSLTIFQYGLIDGPSALFHAFLIRFSERSGLRDSAHSDLGYNYLNLASYPRLWSIIESGFFPLVYFLAGMLLLILFLKGYRYLYAGIRKDIRLLSLAILPGILHLLVFFNSSVIHGHCISVLGPGAAIASGILAYWAQQYPVLQKSYWWRNVLPVAILFLVIFSSGFYYYHSWNRPKKDYSFLTKAASLIQKDAGDEDALFLNVQTELANPELFISYAANRNMACARDSIQAVELFRKSKKRRGVFYQFTESGKPPLIFRMRASG